MRVDHGELCRSFPWLEELWLLDMGGGATAPELLAVCSGPPRQIAPGQRRRLLGLFQDMGQHPVALRVASKGQLSRWLDARGRFATQFRRQAVKLFQRLPDS